MPGAPANPFFVHLNNAGNIAIVETPTTTRDFWFFEAETQSFTNISSLPNFPGNSLASFGWTAFDLNDNNKVSFHSGDNNFGDVYIYDHASGNFDKVTDQPGGPTRGRENEINNSDQVLYAGFPASYLYDPSDGSTTNINDLPGGPGSAITNQDLNDLGDVALTSASVSVFYDASNGTFTDLTTTPGWPPDIISSSRSDLSNSGEITFWREGLFVFDTNTSQFSQLNGFPGGPPLGGLETRLNSSGQIALNTGVDVYLATPRPYGDYDNDGNVDGDDLAQFETTYGDSVAIGTAADGDSNRIINGGDFLVWQRNFDGLATQTAAHSVPEPAYTILVLSSLVAFSCSRSIAKP